MMEAVRTRTAQIVGIGACVADTLWCLPSYPTEDTKTRATDVKQAGGGPVATGLVAAEKLGAHTAFIGTLADDASGRFLLSDFEKYGVETDLVSVLAGYRSFSSVLLLAADRGTRTCAFDRGDLPPTELNGAQRAAIEAAELLMVDGNELDAAVEGARLARAAGKHVLYDCGGNYPNVSRLLAVADILIPSEEFALAETGCETAEEAAHALFERYHPAVVVITQGKRGGILFDGKTVRAYPCYPAEVVDSNGAGDVFHGAFAAAMLRGHGFETCCHFASATSALKCTGVGARESVPSFETVRNYLRENGYEF